MESKAVFGEGWRRHRRVKVLGICAALTTLLALTAWQVSWGYPSDEVWLSIRCDEKLVEYWCVVGEREGRVFPLYWYARTGFGEPHRQKPSGATYEPKYDSIQWMEAERHGLLFKPLGGGWRVRWLGKTRPGGLWPWWRRLRLGELGSPVPPDEVATLQQLLQVWPAGVD